MDFIIGKQIIKNSRFKVRAIVIYRFWIPNYKPSAVYFSLIQINYTLPPKSNTNQFSSIAMQATSTNKSLETMIKKLHSKEYIEES